LNKDKHHAVIRIIRK